MLTCDVGDLVAGGATLFTITVDVAPDVVDSAGGPTTITNTVSVDGVGNEATRLTTRTPRTRWSWPRPIWRS